MQLQSARTFQPRRSPTAAIPYSSTMMRQDLERPLLLGRRPVQSRPECDLCLPECRLWARSLVGGRPGSRQSSPDSPVKAAGSL
jgi:hypothetical protein